MPDRLPKSTEKGDTRLAYYASAGANPNAINGEGIALAVLSARMVATIFTNSVAISVTHYLYRFTIKAKVHPRVYS